MKQIDPAMTAPVKQVFGLLQTFITGKPLVHGRQFHILHPEKQDVWELKTVDVRIFGWFHERNRFVAVRGASMEQCKNDGYAEFRNEVVAYRAALDLDEPKFKQGAKIDDVISV
ncbi:hypothetical protein [Mesorhizobium sp. B2-6-5]|uniref:hypothetical protein n=1 Tax=Mesorhizobium sp. B2-6-5 TaxID=2589912 RepID=UPI00112B2FD6|nr:hypothetical protein [Mesorhizobium sp. B2-6-5]TPJ34283.1 hypothetical protein FJ432_30130 [Mesorhizobium sp. B2-6-5]